MGDAKGMGSYHQEGAVWFFLAGSNHSVPSRNVIPLYFGFINGLTGRLQRRRAGGVGPNQCLQVTLIHYN